MPAIPNSPCSVCGWPNETQAWQEPDTSWRVRCPRCGDYRIADADRTALLDRPPPPFEPGMLLPDEGAPDIAGFPIARAHLVSGYLRELTVAGHGGGLLTAESARTMAESAPRTVSER